MASQNTTPSHQPLPDRLTLRVPLGLPQAVEAAARSQLTSSPEYVRRALLQALRGDGVHLGADGEIELDRQDLALIGAETMPRAPHNPGSWPPIMRAETAAGYCDERTVEAFLRGVGTHYPEPTKVKGKGDRWLRVELDVAIERLTGRATHIKDAADAL